MSFYRIDVSVSISLISIGDYFFFGVMEASSESKLTHLSGQSSSATSATPCQRFLSQPLSPMASVRIIRVEVLIVTGLGLCILDPLFLAQPSSEQPRLTPVVRCCTAARQ